MSPVAEGIVDTDRTLSRSNAPASRVLIVEDDYIQGIEAEAALVEGGLEVVGITNSVAEAVSLAKAKRPDLVLMDVRLGGAREGIDAALAIFWATGIRCVFATAHADPRTRSLAAPANPFGWLPKPYSAGDLVAIVRKALSKP
jgi:DNA-binding NarL/FixJ family response regulator